MRKKAYFIICCMSIFFMGCAAWQVVSKTSTEHYGDFEYTLPKDWVKYNASPDIVQLTKDGLLLQNIRFFKVKLDKELENTKRKFTNNMLIQEAAKLAIDELTSDKDLLGLKILENKPAVIGGEEGFSLVYIFHTPEGLRYRVVRYGFKDEKYVYFIQYKAAQQYYFDKDAVLFSEFVKEFKVRENSGVRP